MRIYSKYIYPKIVERLLSKPSIMKYRKDILSNASGNILEIGFGTGLNLSCYPDFVNEITVLETNDGMNILAKQRINESKIKVNFKLLSAESLPFQDAMFDTVVSAFTFCSIENIDAAMKEFFRVLKPDGKLLFLEHGLSSNKRIGSAQNFINPFYKLFSNGCNLNRNIKAIIEKGGFKISSSDEFYEKSMIKMIGYLIKGIASKK